MIIKKVAPTAQCEENKEITNQLLMLLKETRKFEMK